MVSVYSLRPALIHFRRCEMAEPTEVNPQITDLVSPSEVNPQITDLTKEADPKGKTKTEDKDQPKKA
jgi:hypothetical protein